MNLVTQNIPGIGTINPPSQVRNIANQSGSQGLSTIINLLISLLITMSAIIFLFMILFAGIQWISSGGNKDKVAAARQKITHAVIGLAIVALVFVITQVVGTILGLDILGLHGNGAPGCTNPNGCPGGF